MKKNMILMTNVGRWFFGCFSLSLVSCASPQYRQAAAECEYLSFDQFPQKIEEFRCEQTRYVSVPSGETECITEKVTSPDGLTEQVKTTCKPLTEIRSQPYVTICQRDVNQTARNNWALTCIAKTCLSNFGNVDCKSKG